jgi:hypothetical protein
LDIFLAFNFFQQGYTLIPAPKSAQFPYQQEFAIEHQDLTAKCDKKFDTEKIKNLSVFSFPHFLNKAPAAVL